MKIKTVIKGAKVGTITFEDNPSKQVKFWISAPFAEHLAIGAEGTPTFRTEPAKGEFPEQKFLKSWNGVEEKAAARGGGGFQRSPQKSPEEVLSEQKNIHASVALQQAVDFIGSYDPIPHDAAARIVAVGKEFFTAMREWVK